MSDALLIDDEELCNFLHELIIKKTGLFDKITSYTLAIEALAQLKLRERTGATGPELILLDLNMRGMDGFQFLDELSKMPAAFIQNVKVIMLTSSMNNQESGRALSYNMVAAFCHKPLTERKMREVLARIYPNWAAA